METQAREGNDRDILAVSDIGKPERVVQPRKTGFRNLPIVAVDERSEETLEESGELGTFTRFVESMPLSDSCLIVTCRSAWVLASIQERWGTTKGWISQTTRRERIYHAPGMEKYGVTLGIANPVPHLCGWRRGPDDRRGLRLSFHFLDPDLFYASEKTVQDIFGTPRDFTATVLMEWAQAVRRFCRENDLPIKQTQGAISAKFLTDRRFYPQARRKVPRATNVRLHSHLPGNHASVRVRTEGGVPWTGLYLDQRRAHHYHARSTRLPDSNSIHAYGDFAGLRRISLDPAAYLGGDFCGVVAGEFTPPRKGTTFLPPRWRRRAVSRRMVSTAEWSWLADIGVACRGLYAAWGSTQADTGIAAYAQHAESELDRWADRPMGSEWLKPVLVSTYGALATNPEIPIDTLVGGEVPNGRTPASWDAGSKRLHGWLMQHTKRDRLEPATANVIHRFLIEAATRTESLAFANHLEWLGRWVLMIHVDAVIIEDDANKEMPILFPPWRLKSRLTSLTFHDNWSFDSLEMTRMPGRPHLADRRMTKVRPPLPFAYEPGLLPTVPDG